MKELVGCGVALVTPFKENGEVDFDGLSNLIEHQIKGGIDYLVVLGTTGETATLSTTEQQEVLAHIKKVNGGRKPLVLGIGGNNTQAVKDAILSADLEGITAILSASPYYNKPTQEGIYQHYKLLATSSPLPIILYNVPGRTASNITAATTLRLAQDFENIIGIKEASADMDQVMKIIKDKPEDFMVISGEDGLTYPIIMCGGVGVISVVANAYPDLFSAMVHAALKCDVVTAKKKHYLLMDFITLLFAEGNPGGIKAALKVRNICDDHLRLPLVNISKDLYSKLESLINSI